MRQGSVDMKHLIKVYVIVAMFTPLACYVAYLLSANQSTLNIFSLHRIELSFMLALLLLPLLGLRQMQICPLAKDIPSEFE